LAILAKISTVHPVPRETRIGQRFRSGKGLHDQAMRPSPRLRGERKLGPIFNTCILILT